MRPGKYTHYPVVNSSASLLPRCCCAPSLILADEPTGALDAANRDVVLQHLRTLADDGATVLISTHDPAVTEFSDAEIRL